MLGRMSARADAPPPRWLVTPAFDLTWFFGGAALSLIVLGLYFVAGAPIVALWWIWLLAFDGPHIGAAFTRTYFDRDEWRRRPGLLLTSLLTFALGPLFLAATIITGSPDPFLLFLALATFYGYYHVVRQHYGFVALYNTVNHDWNPRSVALDKWTLYIGCWAPYAYFLLTHPKARELLRLTTTHPAPLEAFAAYALLALWLIVIGRFILRHLADEGFRLRNPKTPYLAGTVILYGFIYFAIARFEPVYGASQGPDQDFLLLSIVIVIFHNLQYVGLVWFHNRNRYAGAGPEHGLASVDQSRAGPVPRRVRGVLSRDLRHVRLRHRRVPVVPVVRGRRYRPRQLEPDRALPVVGTGHEPLLPRSEDLADSRRRCAQAQPASGVS